MRGMKDSEQETFHENIRSNFQTNLLIDMITPSTLKEY